MKLTMLVHLPRRLMAIPSQRRRAKAEAAAKEKKTEVRRKLEEHIAKYGTNVTGDEIVKMIRESRGPLPPEG